jgi:sulfate permease, SulP family
MFRPKLLDTLASYNKKVFLKDLTAGVVVGIVALPLAIAFAIASGVSPEKGLITAIIAGFIISAMGGSKVQIGGPTGAFIVIVYGIVTEFGFNGLLIATFMAGVMLILFGVAKFGNVIKVIPYPLIVGFTAGIAIIIFSSQVKDVLGLPIQNLPSGFIEKWEVSIANVHSSNPWSISIAVSTMILVILFSRISSTIPGSLVAIVTLSILTQLFHLPVETIGSRFGNVSATLASPQLPHINLDELSALIRPAFTIALLAGIESLLSAVVADGMTGGNHRSNMELVAQGVANMASAVFGGIPATGAIARTATNIKNGGRTPIAGIVHSITLLIIMLIATKWTAYIPMSCLAGILVIVAYNMSEWENFYAIAKGNRGDTLVMVATFLLTVLFDLTLALEVGMVLAVFLFFRKMIQLSSVKDSLKEKDDDRLAEEYPDELLQRDIHVFEVSGPLFFGAAYKFRDSLKALKKRRGVLIVRMRKVPVIDTTGIRTLHDVYKTCVADNIQLMLSEVQPAVLADIKQSRLLFKIGKRYVTEDFKTAILRARELTINLAEQTT